MNYKMSQTDVLKASQHPNWLNARNLYDLVRISKKYDVSIDYINGLLHVLISQNDFQPILPDDVAKLRKLSERKCAKSFRYQHNTIAIDF